MATKINLIITPSGSIDNNKMYFAEVNYQTPGGRPGTLVKILYAKNEDDAFFQVEAMLKKKSPHSKIVGGSSCLY